MLLVTRKGGREKVVHDVTISPYGRFFRAQVGREKKYFDTVLSFQQKSI